MKDFAKGLGLGLLIGYAGFATIAAGGLIFLYAETTQALKESTKPYYTRRNSSTIDYDYRRQEK